MAIEILCEFTGGPQGDETLTLHQYFCLDRLTLEIAWLKPLADGSSSVMKGERPRQSDWIGATKACYTKASPISNGKVTYQFEKVIEVRRCEKTLAKQGRLCRHEAIENERFCKTHLKELNGSVST